jgi:tetratricopeptide (TPR) repeat protein
MPPAENTPDFDSMSPEELMAWMETLAERQGASEGFTTDKRVEIDEVDPDSVEDSGPGYIPYGMTEEQWAAKQAEEEAAKAARRAAAQSARPAPVEPAPEPVMEESDEFDLPDSAEIETGPLLEDESEEFELPQLGADLEATTDLGLAEGGVEGMAWLESLAADEADDFPQVDLSELGRELEGLELEDAGEPQADVNPMEWLDGLMQEQGEAFDLPTSEADQSQPLDEADAFPPAQPSAARPAASADEADPMEWLESLAREEGASTEEFITDAGLEISEDDDFPMEPVAEEDDALATRELPDFDAVDELDRADVTDADDPVAWLDSLAAAQGAEIDLSADDEIAYEDSEEIAAQAADQAPIGDEIVEKLNAAQDISPEEMKDWMDNLLEKGAVRTDISDYIDEDEEEDEALEAQIPDWLVEQVGPPPDLSDAAPQAEPDMAPGFDELAEVDETVEEDIPDWLRDEQFESQGDMELQSIFAAAEEEDEEIFAEPEEPEPVSETAPDLEIDSEIDTSDPWVEAFEMERLQGMDDINTIPDWYAEKLSGGDAVAASAPALEESQLEPEAALEPGEAEALPDWLDTTIEEDDRAETDEALAGDIPDWLRDQVDSDQIAVDEEEIEGVPDWLQSAGIEDAESVPDWLMETAGDEEEVAAPAAQQPAPTPEPQPIPQQPAAQASPAPVPASDIDADAVLQTARESVGQGDVTGGLMNYETIVRANAHLDAVVGDLSQLIRQEAHVQNAAAYRVLGDGLMRQGRLQEALDTYRKALNLL